MSRCDARDLTVALFNISVTVYSIGNHGKDTIGQRNVLLRLLAPTHLYLLAGPTNLMENIKNDCFHKFQRTHQIGLKYIF